MAIDYSAGDTICMNCGLVCASQLMDDGPEWFGADNARACVQNAVAIGGNGFSNLLRTNAQLQERRITTPAIDSVGKYALSLPEPILHDARAFYKDVREAKTCRADILLALEACCVYFACRVHKAFRSEIEIKTAFAVDDKAFSNAQKTFKNATRERHYYDVLFARSAETENRSLLMVRRSVQELSLSAEVEKAVMKSSEAILNTICEERLLDGKTENAIVSVAIYLAMLKNEQPIARSKFAEKLRLVTGVTLANMLSALGPTNKARLIA